MENLLNINIIGNGFDKMHGIDSTYHDFLEYLKKETLLSETNYICKEMIEKNLSDTWIDCESYLNKLFNGFIKFKENKLEVEVSEEVDVFINYANNKYGNIKNGSTSMYNLGDVINLYKRAYSPNQYTVIKNEILKVIGSSETFLIEKIESDLLTDYYELRNILIKYLKLQEGNFKGNNNFNDCIENNKFNENGICLNFNYTKTAWHYFNNVHHIHGDLRNENIVWGYYNCAMENVCKSWQVLCLNAGNLFFSELWISLDPNVIDTINLNIWGHSIGQNDIEIYNNIIKMIEYKFDIEYDEKNNEKKPNIAINYTYYDSEKQIGKDQISKVKNIKTLGSVAEEIINNRKLNGYNTKYEFKTK